MTDERRRPKARLEFKAKDGTRYEIGAVWPGQVEWSDGVSLQKENIDHEKYPKMRFTDALRRMQSEGGYINLVWPREQGQKPKRNEARREPNDGGGFGDDDIPFDRIRGEV